MVTCIWVQMCSNICLMPFDFSYHRYMQAFKSLLRHQRYLLPLASLIIPQRYNDMMNQLYSSDLKLWDSLIYSILMIKSRYPIFLLTKDSQNLGCIIPGDHNSILLLHRKFYDEWANEIIQNNDSWNCGNP